MVELSWLWLLVVLTSTKVRKAGELVALTITFMEPPHTWQTWSWFLLNFTDPEIIDRKIKVNAGIFLYTVYFKQKILTDIQAWHFF